MRVFKGLVRAAACGLFTLSVLANAAAGAVDGTAPSSTDAVSELADVVVTARKVVENAQDAPISLVVASGQELESRSIFEFKDLQQIAPSLNVATSYLSADSIVLAMRGQALTDTRLNVDPAIGIYIDGVYIPRAQGTEVADMFDINRVEVLAGPQGTLYGKNTTGGAVNIYTNSPVATTEATVRARYGTFGEYALETMYNTPLTDTLNARFVVAATGRQGYGTNYYNGENLGQSGAVSLRLSALWNATDALQVTFRGNYSQSQDTASAWKGVVGLQPSSFAIPEVCLEMGSPASACFTPGSPQSIMAAAALRSYNNANYNNGDMDIQPHENFAVWGGSVTLDWEIDDSLSLKSISAEYGFSRLGAADLDGTPYQILDYPYLSTRDHQWSEELQLSGNSLAKRLNWITGLYYSNELGREYITQVALADLSGAAGPTFQQANDIGAQSVGVFGQANYSITNELIATAGYRMTHDERKLDQSNFNNLQCLSLGELLSTLPSSAACSLPMNVSSTRPSYTIGLEYHASPDLMLYGKTNQSYRSGGLQQTSGGSTPEEAAFLNQPFKPETVKDYEAGMKSELFERRIKANISVYYSKLYNAIRTVSQPIPGSTAVGSAIENAATATVKGTEFELRTARLYGFEFSVNAAYTDAYFNSYITPTGQNLTSIPLLFTPKWSYGASIGYTATADWRTQLDWTWRSQELTAEPAGYAPANGILNARSTWHVARADFDLSVYGKNLLQERYLPYPVDVTSGLGFMLASIYNPPRTFGVELTKHF